MQIRASNDYLQLDRPAPQGAPGLGGLYAEWGFERARYSPLRHRRLFTLGSTWREVIYPLQDLSSPEATIAMIDWSLRATWSGYADARFALAKVQLSGVQPLSRVLEVQRYERMRRYHQLLTRHNLPPFLPVAVSFRFEPNYRVALPPVLELHGDRLVVVDGTHRLKLLLDGGATEAVCVVVTGDLPNPPSIPFEWDDVHVLEGKRSRTKKFRNFRRRWFRPTGAFLRGPRFDYPSVAAVRRDCFDALETSSARDSV